MKLWIDDQLDDKDCPNRLTPGGYEGAKTAKEAIKLLKTGEVTHVDFDHDLGDNSLGNGYTVAQFIEREAFYKKIAPITWNIHSANPVGSANIKRAMESAERFWAAQES